MGVPAWEQYKPKALAWTSEGSSGEMRMQRRRDVVFMPRLG